MFMYKRILLAFYATFCGYITRYATLKNEKTV